MIAGEAFSEENLTPSAVPPKKINSLGFFSFYVETPDDAATIIFDLIMNNRPLDSFE